MTRCAWCGREGVRGFVPLNHGLVRWAESFEQRRRVRVLLEHRRPVVVCTALRACARRRARRVGR